VPSATASAFAAGAQQAPAAVAASAVPQQVVAGATVAGALPQQPLEAGGVKASAGSPANPPMVSLVMETPGGVEGLEAGGQLESPGAGVVEQGTGAALTGAYLYARLAELDGRCGSQKPSDQLDHEQTCLDACLISDLSLPPT
jgi:hypothetical protein